MSGKGIVCIAGATGKIGKYLCRLLAENDYSLRVISRRNGIDVKKVIPQVDEENVFNWDNLKNAIQGSQVVVNLAGESIAGYPSKSKFERVLNTRVEPTKKMVKVFSELSENERPNTFIAAAAVGYYKSSYDPITEDNDQVDDGPIGEMCVKWEQASRMAEEYIKQVCYLRIGIVLVPDEVGFLQGLTQSIKYFRCGGAGDGTAHVPWIHPVDVSKIALTIIKSNGALSGVVNVSAPTPVPASEMALEIGKRIGGKEPWFNIPLWLPTLIVGKKLVEGALGPKNMIPKKLLDSGFEFTYPTIDIALDDLIGKKND